MSETLTRNKPKKSGRAPLQPAGGEKWGMEKANPPSGVVGVYVQGRPGKAPGKAAAKGFAPSRIVELIQRGLPVEELDVLQASLDVPIEKLAPRLGISKATLHRRKAAGRLGAAESDRVVRFARLVGKAVEVFRGLEEARGWLSSPQFGLGGAVPLDYA